MELQQLSLFDYDALDSETRIVVQQRTSEIKTLMRRTAEGIIEIGNKLIEVKDKLGHGRFGGWLKAEFEWDQKTAWNFMQVAVKFGNFPNLDFAPSALYLLAAPSTPEPARLEAIGRAESGEAITHAKAQAIVIEHKNPPPMTFDERKPIADSPASYIYVDTETGQIGADIPIENEPEAEIVTQSSGRQKPKINRAGNEYVPQGFDACQTPAYAVDPLCPFIDANWTFWEPATGEGLLRDALYDCGVKGVLSSDLITGQNFFDYQPSEPWDCLITNPPYSIKYRWLERCYALGKPFALLLPVETLGAKTAQVMFKAYGLELILLDQRINFKMPNIGFDGSSAQFPVAWFTWGLNIGQQITFAEVKRG